MPRRRRGQRNSTSADVIAAVRQLVLIANDDLIAGRRQPINQIIVNFSRAAILATAQEEPELTGKAIAEKFGVSTATVSLVLRGKRGRRRLTQLRQLGLLPTVEDKELVAITAVMTAIADLNAQARRRVVEYAIQRLNEEQPNEPEGQPCRLLPVTQFDGSAITPNFRGFEQIGRREPRKHWGYDRPC